MNQPVPTEPVCIFTFLNVEKDGISVRHDETVLGVVKTEGHLREVLMDFAHKQGLPAGTEVEFEFMCSSSLDFPEEYTKDELVISLANRIRGNE